MGKLTISMAMFNSYVSQLPEGTHNSNSWHAIRWSQMISDLSGGRIPPRLEAIPEVIETFPAARLVLCCAKIWHGPLHWETRIPSECLARHWLKTRFNWVLIKDLTIPKVKIYIYYKYIIYIYYILYILYIYILYILYIYIVGGSSDHHNHRLTKDFEEIIPLAELRQTPEWINAAKSANPRSWIQGLFRDSV
jgi:hypothetical protein